ncbi:GDSL esterase/lipase At5g14450-like [Coffea eugenioides]|uniref:GDSL esterase/lipase At5g14450-like n=1 Tax=Coffea eugenioides TaxID=49369 RepID=UPI000F60B335|nr:GDSL esterase/lipase At5g14450-like [Coffea eugenioides]
MEPLRAVFLVVIVFSCGLTAETTKKVVDLQSRDYSALYNFGDSNSDTGGMAAAFFPMIAPCGETYIHRLAGRGFDGRLIIDVIAEHLALPLLSPYLDSVGTSFRHGANFATGGATIRRQNESWFQTGVSPFPLDIQVEHYPQFKARTAYFYNQVATIKVQNPEPGYLDDHGCKTSQNHMAVKFNKKLKHSIIQLRAELSEATITYVDMYRAKYDLIRNAKEQGTLLSNQCQFEIKIYTLIQEPLNVLITPLNFPFTGFENPFKICCGLHGIDFDVWCSKKATINGSEVYAGSCAKPSAIISWDGVHYSQAANNWIASRIVNGSLSDPPMPITQACRKKI